MRSEAMAAVVFVLALSGCGTNDRIFTDNVVDPQNLSALTKFRSCCGHSFAVGETNRTMKHYLVPNASLMGTDNGLPVYAPCDGELVSITPEWNRLDCLGGVVRGYQVRIVPRERPDVSLRIFHVNPTRGPGAVESGEQVGYADVRFCSYGGQGYADFDVSVEKLGAMYSYIDWLDDGAFAPWKARGLASRDAAYITKDARDADPCNYDDITQCQKDTIVFQ